MADWNRREVLWSGVGLLTSAATFGCMPKAPTITASKPTPIAVAGVLAGKKAAVQGLPEGVQRRIVKALEARKLVPTVLPIKQVKDPLSNRRGTPQRLGWLAENAGESGVVMLVELEAFYDTQIQGRLRWTVQGTVSVARTSEPEAAIQRTIQTAVFLQFLHQAESEAALEAATTIERAAHRLLDDWLRIEA
jgi:hypothetical protein